MMIEDQNMYHMIENFTANNFSSYISFFRDLRFWEKRKIVFETTNFSTFPLNLYETDNGFFQNSKTSAYSALWPDENYWHKNGQRFRLNEKDLLTPNANFANSAEHNKLVFHMSENLLRKLLHEVLKLNDSTAYSSTVEKN